MLSEPFVSIISTRLLISDKKRQFLDLKIGNTMMQKVTRMETTQVIRRPKLACHQEGVEFVGLLASGVANQ